MVTDRNQLFGSEHTVAYIKKEKYNIVYVKHTML